MKLRSLLTLALATAFVFVAPITAKADVTEGWQGSDSEGWWYQTVEEDGTSSYYANGVQTIDGKMYYFDKSGWMQKGWIYHTIEGTGEWYDWENDSWVDVQENSGYWLHTNDKGEIQTGWQKIDGEWYFFDYCGRMYEDGTREVYPVVTDENGDVYQDYSVSPTMYHFAPTGEMTTGWYYHDYPSGWGEWFYSTDNGVVYTGWQKIGGEWYLFSEYDGSMYADTSYTEWIDVYDEDGNWVDSEVGNTYFFKEDGAMIKGWYNYEPYSTYGSWVYCNSDGTAYDGWLQSGADWYYIANGYMRAGAYKIDYKEVEEDGSTYLEETARYYLGRDGKMITGWYNASYENETSSSTRWMYASSDGIIKAQWVKSGSDWYFINSDGYMVADGSCYCESDDEKEPTRKDYASDDEYYEACYAWESAHYYVFGADGKMLTNTWYVCKDSRYGTTWYYADADGKGHNGWIKDGGLWYYCIDGEMQRDTYVEGGYWVNSNGVWTK